jgi:hypothetical protein
VHLGQEVRQLGLGEGQQLHPLHLRKPQQLTEQGPERMPAVQVVSAIAGDHQQPVRAEPGQQEADQIPGRGVRPVQVLDDQQQRRDLVADPAQHVGHRLEQRQPVQAGVARRAFNWCLAGSAGDPAQPGSLPGDLPDDRRGPGGGAIRTR